MPEALRYVSGQGSAKLAGNLALIRSKVTYHTLNKRMPESAAADSITTFSSFNPRINRMVKLHTNYGVITLELFADKAPKTVENFKQYVRDGHYDNTIFHRVISNFMIQGGGFGSGMQEKETRAPIENEANNGVANELGTVAMARTMDPHSASAQFFINVADNSFLNHTAPNTQGWGYAVFGKVTDGMDVVEKIKDVRTTSRNGHQDVPADEVIIERAELVE